MRVTSDSTEKLIDALLAENKALKAKVAEQAATVPDVLFDGFAVYSALDERAKARTSPENVSDTLDAVVRILRAAPAEADRRDALRYRGLRDLASKARAEWEIEGKQYGLMLGAEPYEIDELVDAALAKGEVAE